MSFTRLFRGALLTALGLTVLSCAAIPSESELHEGRWRAWLDSPGGELPFGLEISRRDGELHAYLLNGTERLATSSTTLEGRRIVIDIAHYDSSITADLDDAGTGLAGRWRKTAAGTGKSSELAFHATAGDAPRFSTGAPLEALPASRWSVRFADDDDLAVGLFETAPDGTIQGTFLTTTGDYRYLAGTFAGNELKLSCFDGAHAFLFYARLGSHGTLAGDFWSRDSWHDTWVAHADADAQLPDPFGQTTLVDNLEIASLVYPDLDGTPRSLAAPEFAGQARLIVVFGSWCPNCNDSSHYLVELDRRYRSRGLRILGLAFELTGDFQRDAGQVRRYAEHHGIEYPLLVAGLSDKSLASEAFPLVDRVRSFPTTLFLDSENRVRAIHTGFNGPATGVAYDELKNRFESLIDGLLDGRGA